MQCYKIIEELQNIISDGSKVPFSNKVILSQEQLFDMIDSLLRALPDDLKTAQRISEDRNTILAEAQNERDMIVKEAKQTIEKMVNQEEITRLAREKSDQIISSAKLTAREIRAGAADYADEILEDLEERLTMILETVKKGREELNQKK
ncbi:MAG: ATPase [Tepidanaerobacteraceae bacterium]|jgi:vacuolar-type H+-ATPase subunit H